MNRTVLKPIFTILVVFNLTACSYAAPVGVASGRGAKRLSGTLKVTVFNPQWSLEKPVYKEVPWNIKPAEFVSYSAMVFLTGAAERSISPAWTEKEIETAVEYVTGGGSILFLGDRFTPANEAAGTGAMGRLLGAKQWTVLQGEAGLLKPGEKMVQGLTALPELFNWTLQGPAAALTELSGAEALIGTPDAAIMTVNRIGKGLVYFLNARITESYTSYPQLEGYRNADWFQLKAMGGVIHRILLEAEADMIREKRELWDPVPLGPKVKDYPPLPKKTLKPLTSRAIRGDLPGKAVILTGEGKALALIILPPSDAPGVHAHRVQAARMLQGAIKKVSGAEVPYAREKEAEISRDGAGNLKAVWRGQEYTAVISIGDTDLAREMGCKSEKLPEEGVAIRIAEQAVLINGGNPRQAVITFLSEFLGFRWLWPGELGEVYFETTAITLAPAAFEDAPALAYRVLRNTYSFGSTDWKSPAGETIKLPLVRHAVAGYEYLGADPRDFTGPAGQTGEWFLYQRLGGAYKKAGGANFSGWWKNYGQEHPEYFALQFDGSRVQKSNRERICESNPEVARHIARETIDILRKRPELKYYHLSPQDGGLDTFCYCENCRKLDPQTDERMVYRILPASGIRPHYEYPSLSDRHLFLYSQVAREVAKEFPDVKLVGLAYSYYRHAPWYYTDIPENLVFSFVGLQYFNRAALQKDRADWDRWSSLSEGMFLRPNALLEGHGMPSVYVKELGYDIKHCYRTGLFAADFDGLTHHWATQGINYYVLARLLWDPSMDIEEIVQDYCRAGFGPAAAEVRRYFTLCEELTSRIAAKSLQHTVGDEEDLTRLRRVSNRRTFLDEIPENYPAADLERLESVLKKAYELTRPGSKERQRVEFLQTGLQYAVLEREFITRYHNREQGGKQLVEFMRKRHEFLLKSASETPFAINMAYIAYHEWAIWRACGWEPRKTLPKDVADD